MAIIRKILNPQTFAGAFSPWTSRTSSYSGDENAAPDDAMRPAPAPANARSGVSLSPAFNPNTNGQPDVARDIYQPQLRDISSRLSEAYNPPEGGVGSTIRHVLGAIMSQRNPQLGSIISGDYQRQRQIAGLTKQYGLTEDAINQERAQQTSAITNRLHNAQADYFEQKPEIAMAPKPTSEEQDVGDLMKQVNPMTGKPFTHFEASVKRAQAMQDVKPDAAKTLTPDEQAMGDLLKTINPRTKKPYTAFEARVKLAQSIQDTKPTPQGAGEHDMEPVMAYDKQGKAHIVPKSEAMAPGSGYSNVIKASDKDLNDAKTHAVVLNDMQSKLNDVVSSADALDQGGTQRAIISKVLSHAEPGMWNDLVKSTMLNGASDKTKNYIQSVLSLKESALGLPKEITGGSRTSEIQGNALFQTLPSGASVDSKYAIGQAKKFQANIDRLRNRVPVVRGMEEITPHPSLSGTTAKTNDPLGIR